MRGLAGKVALVAGGGSGIGAATAARIAEEGASVVVGDLAVVVVVLFAVVLRPMPERLRPEAMRTEPVSLTS